MIGINYFCILLCELFICMCYCSISRVQALVVALVNANVTQVTQVISATSARMVTLRITVMRLIPYAKVNT